MFKKKWICGAVSLMILLLFTVPIFSVYAQEAERETLAAQREYTENCSIGAYQKLLAYLSTECDDSVAVQNAAAHEEKTDLATAYAGAYINDAGTLVINVTDDSAIVQQEIQQATGNASVQYQLVANNLDTLQAVNSDLVGHLREAPYFKVVLSETHNEVEVYTEEDAEACMDYVRTITDASVVTVIEEANAFTDL